MVIQYSSGQVLDIVREVEDADQISIRINVDPIKNWFYGSHSKPERVLRSNACQPHPDPRSWCVIRCENEQLPAYIIDVSYTIKPGDHEALYWMIVLYGDDGRTAFPHSTKTKPYVRPHDISGGSRLTAGGWSQKTIDTYLDLKSIEEDGIQMYEGNYKGRCCIFDINRVQCSRECLRKLRVVNVDTVSWAIPVNADYEHLADTIYVTKDDRDPQIMLELAACSKERRDSGLSIGQEGAMEVSANDFPFDF
ncbi:hypothetical protein LTR56_020756 [Elasticomyces elasticus]|nr:hypothetical protein LTR22_025471 [Elasticomyces elasticus]KAK3624859.1 hypothetical protein LTR56_020756 [Elasticomyces elasticus]KAK4909861.1 hypothetical protein LTR49_021401 [Elasticomyces elasticus]